MEKEIKILKEMINEANSIIVFTGAGISTASGIPDFRSSNGLYNQKVHLLYNHSHLLKP